MKTESIKLALAAASIATIGIVGLAITAPVKAPIANCSCEQRSVQRIDEPPPPPAPEPAIEAPQAVTAT